MTKKAERENGPLFYSQMTDVPEEIIRKLEREDDPKTGIVGGDKTVMTLSSSGMKVEKTRIPYDPEKVRKAQEVRRKLEKKLEEIARKKEDPLS